ncbi:copper resistance protein NlpE N-terminal domain-containing protein [Pontibacter ummariensis]|nr:copper resistance protein NlpE N-terminal domain-containing protein [Pontibacter ummariensis]
MKRRKLLIAVWVLLYTATACTTNTNSTVPLGTSEIDAADVRPVDVTVGGEAYPFPVVGVWHGIIPCVDCPGIVYDLTLNEDNTFEETRVYQAREEEPLTRTGSWRVADGVLELDYPDAERARFDLSTAGELRMLDPSGTPVEAPLANTYRLRRETDIVGGNADLLNEQRRTGVDFAATGNEPGWSLAIDLEDNIYFKTLPSESTAIEAPVPDPVKSGNSTTYRTQAEGKELVVELVETPCTDTMSGKVSPYTVRVTAGGVAYTGCGRYLGEESQK